MNKKTRKRLQKVVDGVLIFAFTFVMTGLYMVNTAQAAALTSKSDTMTRLEASAASDHLIEFTTPTGIAASATLIITFPAAFDTASIDDSDIDLADDGVDVTLAAAPSGSTWGAVMASDVLTFTNGDTAVAAGSVITIEIGENATGGTGNAQITNPGSAGEVTIAITGSFGDTGDINIPIIADDTVTVTATVDESISFAISDTTVEFGTLTSGAVRYADDSGGDPADQVAHNITVATNASGGYSITYSGATLTSGSDTIDVAANIATGGTPGTEQFAMSIDNGAGDAVVTTDYDYETTPEWTFSTTSQPIEIVSENGPTATETLEFHYLANISGTTEAGAYSTDITYIATATY